MTTTAKPLTPRQIVAELDRYIIGQGAAKRAVAVAIRNRWRRQQLPKEVAGDVYPKNIIMIGPTGVGKTEIARRLAHLTGAPFIKVEASRYTEVGYHGRDVESMVRDLLDHALSLVRSEQAQTVQDKASQAAQQRLLDILLPPRPSQAIGGSFVAVEDSAERRDQTRQKLLEQLQAGALDDREVEITISTRPSASIMFANMGIDQMDPDMANMFERMIPEQTNRRKVTVAEAKRILAEQETDKLLDREKITAEAIRRTEESGIIFLDEIDKIATPGGESSGGGSGGRGPDVSRQGVQRDLLPIVEGSAVTTRHGVVHTDHVLFIAAGAFHSAAVSDLMPELQGRFPIRVELSPLGKDDFVRILTEPHNALTRQQQALLGVEGLTITFDAQAIEAIADLAAKANATLENIGARRLMTIVEKVFEEISFDAPQRVARGESSLAITAEFVRTQVAPILQDEDLSRFVL
ncbi:MAG: ATP-dependent protease ATPase subunit HslU [Phycisphaeraceae bacterium]|nr:ATP-dependent protease ATPase subunit HslU [Phycisphaeraceae bacterium]